MAASSTAPGSPGKATLHRANATSARHQRAASCSAPSVFDAARFDPEAESRRRTAVPRTGTIMTPPSPGKENAAPLPALPIEARYGALGQRPSSPTHQTPKSPTKGKPRARSVSPSKALRIRSRKQKTAMPDDGLAKQPGRSVREIDYDFVSMLNEMQIPSALMHKLMALDAHVKESMMEGQATLTLSALGLASDGKNRPALSDRFMRSKSSINLAASGHDDMNLHSGSTQSRTTSGESSGSSGTSSCSNGRPRDGAGLTFPLNQSSSSLVTVRSRSTSFAKESVAGRATTTTSSMGASSYATMLKATDSSRLDIGRMKKLRAVLSSESPAWLGQFFDEGGYQAMVFRLQELLEIEWRDEQHDDQLLHELLRCFVALASTECGRQTLTSVTPTPFVELSDLLFSEKRPGDLATRKLLVELLCMLPDLPSPGLHAMSRSEQVRSTRVSSSVLARLGAKQDGNELLTLLLTLLHNPRDPNEEALVDFISASHTPRPFKSLVTELLNINRDYFWVFCHSSNRFWALRDVNVNEVQGPKVPGGMTGGVEFEAMSYLTSHLRLLNLVAGRLAKMRSFAGMEGAAYDFHALLFASGIDRLLAITRKASQNYYQPLHLELARYFDLARRAGFRLPVELEAWQSQPQLLPFSNAVPLDGSEIRQPKEATASTSGSSTQHSSQRMHASSSHASRELLSANLCAPLLNPHAPSAKADPNFAFQGTIVGDAVRRWEKRAAGSGVDATAEPGQAKRQAADGSVGWMPPKEWS